VLCAVLRLRTVNMKRGLEKPDTNRPDWNAKFMSAEQEGTGPPE
jgi:hypothetical protein